MSTDAGSRPVQHGSPSFCWNSREADGKPTLCHPILGGGPARRCGGCREHSELTLGVAELRAAYFSPFHVKHDQPAAPNGSEPPHQLREEPASTGAEVGDRAVETRAISVAICPMAPAHRQCTYGDRSHSAGGIQAGANLHLLAVLHRSPPSLGVTSSTGGTPTCEGDCERFTVGRMRGVAQQVSVAPLLALAAFAAQARCEPRASVPSRLDGWRFPPRLGNSLTADGAERQRRQVSRET